MQTVRIYPDEHLAAVYAAALVEHTLRRKPGAVLGLATGATQIPLYAELRRLSAQGLSWRSATTINLDEYVGVGRDHPHSFHSYMRKQLFDAVDLAPEHRHIPAGDAPDLTAECARYDAVVREHPIDLQVLGIGVNGHIGFNEPGDALSLRTHVVSLKAETIARCEADFATAAVPRQAITVGLEAIVSAKRVLLLAFGADKAAAVAAALGGVVRTDVPASVLQVHADVTWVLDAAAASGLER
ncbi:MAG: glucosamine-6-phosphate deaminase [Firmicutes bacterium]|nr:glucosamine-6-phosphate deaminase [Bacillota bacterium]